MRAMSDPVRAQIVQVGAYRALGMGSYRMPRRLMSTNRYPLGRLIRKRWLPAMGVGRLRADSVEIL